MLIDDFTIESSSIMERISTGTNNNYSFDLYLKKVKTRIVIFNTYRYNINLGGNGVTYSGEKL